MHTWAHACRTSREKDRERPSSKGDLRRVNGRPASCERERGRPASHLMGRPASPRIVLIPLIVMMPFISVHLIVLYMSSNDGYREETCVRRSTVLAEGERRCCSALCAGVSQAGGGGSLRQGGVSTPGGQARGNARGRICSTRVAGSSCNARPVRSAAAPFVAAAFFHDPCHPRRVRQCHCARLSSALSFTTFVSTDTTPMSLRCL